MRERRHFLAAGAVSTLIGPSSVSLAQAPAPAGAPVPTDWKDGLAHSIPYGPPPGTGKERGLVLGGGGAYLASWMAGYFTALKSKNVDVAQADIAVGTSAGSVMGATLMGGHLWSFHSKLDILGEFPKLFAMLIPTTAPNLSQVRARGISNAASQASPKVIQSIGSAAMAARNPAGPSDYLTTVKRLIG